MKDAILLALYILYDTVCFVFVIAVILLIGGRL